MFVLFTTIVVRASMSYRVYTVPDVSSFNHRARSLPLLKQTFPSLNACSIMASLHHTTAHVDHDKAADHVRKTKRFEEHPERAVLDAGKKRAPLAKVDTGAQQVRCMHCCGFCSCDHKCIAGYLVPHCTRSARGFAGRLRKIIITIFV